MEAIQDLFQKPLNAAWQARTPGIFSCFSRSRQSRCTAFQGKNLENGEF
ncbi:MAG: hypothetical protein ACOC0W_07310 [Desulfosalsimonas sp.]